MRKISLIVALFVCKLAIAQPKLSWEEKNKSNIEWTVVTLNAVENHFESFNKAEDMKDFCPNYDNLNHNQKVHAWGELISAITYFESSWNRFASMEEQSLGKDPVTGEFYISSGLMQLSYGDKRWAKWCQFDWETDRTANKKDVSIFKAKNNLECGIKILANQIEKRHKIVLDRGAYWAVIKKDNRHKKINSIQAMVKKLDFCEVEQPQS